MKDKILAALKNIESKQSCKVLFACESGSRAWGFASPDSDFDVRFIYVNRLDWYLRIDETTDTINTMLPDELDVSGWELQKTLKLFAKCNLPLYEWLDSPCIYYQDTQFYQTLRSLIPYYFNPKKAAYHYLSTANKMIETYFRSDTVNIKKLFYVIRPLLACNWIINRKTMPPTTFNEVFNHIHLPKNISDYVEQLLIEKHDASERHSTQLPEFVHLWINEQVEEITIKINSLNVVTDNNWEQLNHIIWNIMGVN
jgi:uncharacterized protein